MKRIFLLLAAVAAFASCVKENDLVPDQTSDNLVTITAVSADTKTTLDGVNVLWEENDAIAVVVEGESDKYLQTFTTSSTEKASTAEFTAVLSDELVADETVIGVGYAVYPAASATYEYGNVSITHELPVEQTGTITKGMNLSYAKVDADDIKEGKANAVFSNALTLLKVNVPEGVKSVVLESDILSPALVGKVNFTVNKTADNISFVKGGAVLTERTVTLSNGGAELDEGVYDLLVFPGTANELTLTMTGTDDAVYESTLNNVVLKPGTYRTIDLTEVFAMDVEADSEVPVSFTGGTFEVNVVAVDDNTYNVAIEDGNSWIQHVQTKAFNGKTIEFNVESNTSTSPRDADITITWEGGSRTFTVVQEGKPELSFVYVDPEDPESGLIQWEETFGVYATEEDAAAVYEYTNVFTIELSDDPSKGTYKVNNIFVYNNVYSGNVAGTYYANYEDGTFTIIKNDSGYPFSNNTVVLTYNKVEKTFTASSPIQFGYKYDATYLKNGGFIKGYTAAEKEDDPGAGGVDASVAKYIGEYVEGSFTSSYNMLTPGILKIEASDDLSKGTLKIVSIFGKTPSNMYASVSSGEIITDANATINDINGSTPIGSLTLNVNPETMNITMSDITLGGWMSISDYAAYSIVGSYVEGSFTSSYDMLTPGILKIEASDDLSKGTLKIVSIFGKTPSNMYASVSGGKIITDANATINDINGSTPIGSLTLSYAINEGKLNITMVDTTIGGWMTVSSYTAVK